MKGLGVIGLVIGFLGLAVGLSLLFSLPVMWLWNGCLVQAVAGISEVSWLQAWGLTILFSMLFKSSGSSSSSKS